jgi:hypothetical protein
VNKKRKTNFPYWRRLIKKQKKVLVEKVISEVMASYKPGQAMDVPIHELTNTPAPPAHIIPVSEKGKFIEDRSRGFLPLLNSIPNDISMIRNSV